MLRRVYPLMALAVVLLAAAAAPSDESPVADAAMKRDTAKVRLLIRQGADVNAAQSDGMTALHWAAAMGDVATTRMLVVAGARVEATTRNGSYTPLHLAARAGRGATVSALIEAGANVNAATTAGGARPLHLAAMQGSEEAVAALLKAGASVDQKDGAWEQTPLMWAANYNRVAVITLLVKSGASLKAMSKIEDTPARDRADRASNQLRQRRVAALKAAEQPPRPAGAAVAAGAGGTTGPQPAQLARARTDSGASPTGRRSATPATAARRDSSASPVRDSAATRRPATDNEPRPANTASDTQQDSARTRAGQERSLGYADLVGNRGGLTPLLFAVRQGNTAAVEALLAAGAPINDVSGGDHTSPLLMATINGHFDIAMQLLAKGADPRLASEACATPLYATINVQWAAKSLYPQPTAQTQQQTTHLELMEALLAKGADPNVRLTKHLWYMSYNFDLLGVNTQGATPFWRAAYGLDVPAMKLLLAHGADPNIPTSKPAGRIRNDDSSPDEEGGAAKDPSGLPPIPTGGPGVYAVHAASGVGYGEGFAANSHRHAPDAWIPAMKFLIEELKMDVNQRDLNGFTPLHHAAARGDDDLIQYLMSKGADITVVSRRGQTVADMANGPVQRIPPFVETVALLEKLGSKNSHKCRSC
ncbi:MAG: ankyrin repeat domain-containing protein [Gemmatimonadaceae bacterium]|nr:ankyrin repeat domain-containing protein [Gemmatimonadaceae bacterium]